MHGKPLPVKPLFKHLVDDQEPDSAQNHQGTGHQIEIHMILIRNQALPASENIKARIVEGSYGMEKTEADGFRHWILPNKNRKAKEGRLPRMGSR